MGMWRGLYVSGQAETARADPLRLAEDAHTSTTGATKGGRLEDGSDVRALEHGADRMRRHERAQAAQVFELAPSGRQVSWV
jgi:hypothetical protein